MAGPKVQVGVDEFTLVLHDTRTDDMEIEDWGQHIDDMLVEFLEKSKLEDLFGKLERANAKLQAGYTDGLTYVDKPWHLMICWNENYVKMGVCVKFSAFAYASYKQAFKKKYNTEINIAGFLKLVQSGLYKTRLSRIDLTADYFDYPDPLFPDSFLEPDAIYNRLNDGTYKIKNYKEKSTLKNFSALHKNGSYETFYAGTRKGKTDGFLRCYDKREEQIQTHGFRYQEAEKCQSWVRFEAVFKQEYAHQITEQLLNEIHTDEELQQAVAKHIVDKYCFYDTTYDAPTTFSNALDEIAAGIQVNALARPNARDNSLAQSIHHLEKSSGLFSTLYKVYEIWGTEGEEKLLEHLKTNYETMFKPDAKKNSDIQYWLGKHFDSLVGTRLEDLF